MYFPESSFFKNSLAGASRLVLINVSACTGEIFSTRSKISLENVPNNYMSGGRLIFSVGAYLFAWGAYFLGNMLRDCEWFSGAAVPATAISGSHT